MASSINPVSGEMQLGNLGSFTPEKQSEIRPLKITDLENQASSSEEQPESSSVLDKRTSFSLGCMRVPNFIYYLICCFLFVCFLPVTYAILTVTTIAVLPLLLGAFVVVRVFQFIVKGKGMERNFLTKILLHYWIFVVVILLLVEVGLFYPIAKFVPELKPVLVIGLPITKWIKIICILIGIYLMSLVIGISIAFVVSDIESDEYDMRYMLLETTYETIGCLLLLWAEVIVMNSVPTFNQSKIFGIYTRKWIKISLFALIGYNIITLLAHILVWSLPKIYDDHLGVRDLNKTMKVVFCDEITKGAFNKKHVVYIATGLKRSVIFILNMVMLLIIWMMYFGNRLDGTPEDKSVLEFGTWTIVSILVCAFLWLIKTCILLYWEAHSVFDRLHPKITAVGKQLYFLIMLSSSHHESVVNATETTESDGTGCGSWCSKTPPKKKAQWGLLTTDAEVEGVTTFDRKTIRATLINNIDPKASSIYDLQKASQMFLTAQHALSKEIVVDDLIHLRDDVSEEDNNGKCIEKLKAIAKFGGEDYVDEDWTILFKLLPGVKTHAEVTFQKVKTFMERARFSCMFLTNTFISEKEVVNCLNRVMSVVIIIAIFVMWLLLTGLATTKVLVVIASPALAVTFIFGDTAKGLFQGLIFVYIVHPYDVGDLCLIDGQLLEVVRIGIWCTTFSSVRTIGEQQLIIYPNSVVSLKNVVNHKTNFNWNDQVEFLCTPDKKVTAPLLHKIETYLDEQKERFTPNFHSVEILEIGDKAKIVVHMKHKLPTTAGWTNFECLKAKEKRRYELAIDIHNFMKDIESGKEARELEEFYTKG